MSQPCDAAATKANAIGSSIISKLGASSCADSFDFGFGEFGEGSQEDTVSPQIVTCSSMTTGLGGSSLMACEALSAAMKCHLPPPRPPQSLGKWSAPWVAVSCDCDSPLLCLFPAKSPHSGEWTHLTTAIKRSKSQVQSGGCLDSGPPQNPGAKCGRKSRVACRQAGRAAAAAAAEAKSHGGGSWGA